MVLLLVIALAAAVVVRAVWQAHRTSEQSVVTAETAAPPADAGAEVPLSPPPLTTPTPSTWNDKRDFLSRVPVNPSDSEALDAADQARQIGDCRSAESILQRAWVRNPQDYSLTIAAADANRALLRIGSARTFYMLAQKKQPERIEAALGLAALALTSDNRKEAWKWMQSATEAVEKHAPTADALLTIARAYQDMNDQEAAEKALKRACDAAPDRPQPRLQLATLLLQSGRIAESSALLEEVLHNQPDNVRACRLLASCLINAANEHPDFLRARLLLEKAVELSPRDIEAYRALGLVYRHEGLIRLAAQMYDSVLRLAPDSPDARYELGQIYALLGHGELSKEQLDLSVSLRRRERELDRLYVSALKHPRNPETHFALARFFETNGQYAGAVREYQISTELDERNEKYSAAQRSLYHKLGWDR